jgi:hypothetical protein
VRRVPVKLQERGQRLQRLAGQRVVLERPHLVVEVAGNRRVVGGDLGEEVVQRRRLLQHRREIAGQPFEQQPLLVAVEEHDVDRRSLLRFRIRPGDRHHRFQQVARPIDEQLAFLGGVGRAVGHADDRAPLDRLPVLASDDQRAQQVDAAFERVVLGVEIQPDQVRVAVRLGLRQRAVPLVRDVPQRPRAVLLGRLAEPLGPVDQLVQPWANRPRRGELPHLRLAAGSRHQVVRQLAVDWRGEVFERGQRLDGGDAAPTQGLLLGAAQVRQQREVFPLHRILHAELGVQAIVALKRQAVRQLVEVARADPPGGGVRPDQQIVRRAEVGVLVGDQFEQEVLQPELGPGRVAQWGDRRLLLRGRGDRRAEQHARSLRRHRHAVGVEQSLEHQVVERDLEPVFDLHLGGGLQVDNQHVQRPGRRARQLDKVHVAAEQPVAQGNF